MKKQTFLNHTFHVKYVIYEKNDTALLIDGVSIINNKEYYTSIPLEPVQFSYLCEQSIGYEKTNALWAYLLDNPDQITELAPLHHLGVPLVFSNNISGLSNLHSQLKSA
jgi:hypothetical protein|tara:strand:+ start:25 stop:351 length:327 start_codon:yes stop_codon:yes gene_type:complete